MLDLVDISHPFEPRIFQDQVGREIVVQRDVNIFIDGSGDEKTAEILIV